MVSTFEDEINKHGRIAYTGVGGSMRPMLRERRDVIIIEKPRGRRKKYDVVLYKSDSGRYVLHRVMKVLDDGYVICGDSCRRLEYGVDDGRIIGVLTEFVRNGKTYTPDSPAYRVYVKLWCGLFPLRAFVLRVRDRLKRRKNERKKQIGN